MTSSRPVSCHFVLTAAATLLFACGSTDTGSDGAGATGGAIADIGGDGGDADTVDGGAGGIGGGIGGGGGSANADSRDAGGTGGGVGGTAGASGSSDAGSDGAEATAGSAGSAGSAGGPAYEACPSGGLEAGDYELTLTHDGVDYDYIVHVPAGYDPTVRTPLVLNWHGLTSNAQRQRDFSAMDPVADAHGFIVVYPDSPDTSWNAGRCCAFLAPNRDDVGFAVALVEEMKRQTCIDERRVYSTGFSNGGYMSHRLACERADVFAAVAPVAGTLSVSTCNPSRPVPVAHFHGTADMNVRYYGGGLTGADSVLETLQAWADRNGCAPQSTVTFSQDDATCEAWTDCNDGVEVKLCSFEGEGHCWPGQASCPYGTATTTLSASEEAARFFERFSL